MGPGPFRIGANRSPMGQKAPQNAVVWIAIGLDLRAIFRHCLCFDAGSAPVKQFLKYNGLSLTLTGLFLLFWAGQAVTGWVVYNGEAEQHGSMAVTFTTYLTSGHFWQATGENWESEFLQMMVYVVFTCFLFQKGSAESKDPDAPPEVSAKPRRSFWYRNSLSLTLGMLFAGSFLIHAAGGWKVANEELVQHGGRPLSYWQFARSAEFWFQSFQNWQSEFLAVLAIVVLSIFLRQEGSPESKAVDAPNSATGS